MPRPLHYTCEQVSQGIKDYLAYLKECNRQCKGGTIKEDLKGLAYFNGRIATEGVILSNGLNGCAKILKGAARYVQSTESALVQLRQLQGISGQKVREFLTKEEIYASTPVGRPGSFLNVVTKNKPEIIDGIKFTGHALDRMQERGILLPMLF